MLGKRRRFKTDILVRNNRISSMEKDGLFVKYTTLSDEEYGKELGNKIVEEARELAEAVTEKDRKEEMADVLEVVDNMLELYHIAMEDVQKIKLKKAG